MKGSGEFKEPSGKYLILADELSELDSESNKGRKGAGCVQSIIAYLRINDIESARQVARIDSDKIVSRAKIARLIRDQLFEGVEPPAGYDEESIKALEI